MSDVRLRVELVLRVDAALDASLLECVDDRRHAFEERCRALLVLETRVERGLGLRPERVQEHGLRAERDLRPDQDPDLVELLPLTIEFEQRSDFEEASRDVEARRDLGPLAEVCGAGPAGDAVVDDEQVAATLAVADSPRAPTVALSFLTPVQ